jgi:hypothetical protein
MTGYQRGLLAEYFTVGWNIVEGIVAIAAGVAAASIGFMDLTARPPLPS